jgi:hypothetical protein
MPYTRAVSHRFSADLWVYPGDAAWYFVTVPKGTSEKIRGEYVGKRRGWGSVPVVAASSGTTWSTSIFPDSKSGCFLLPVKASVRRALKLRDGDPVQLSLTIDTARP